MIGIVNYGCGNFGSIQNMLDYIGFDSEIITTPNELSRFNVLFLPGVGSFDTAMKSLNDGGWIKYIHEYVRSGNKLIGICLGMQLLSTVSDEGILPGLNFIPGKVKRIPEHYITPHMGWNSVKFMNNFNDKNKFYFVHSYHYIPDEKTHVLGTTSYNFEFVSAVNKGNVFGFQFHPEKSHKYGMKLLKAVIESNNV